MSLIPPIFRPPILPGNAGQRGGNLSGIETAGGGEPAAPTPAVDVVGVWGKSGQLFPLARPGKATVLRSAKLAEHPVESGGTIVDNRVILPVEIELTLWVTEYATTYERLKSAFLGNELLTVQTRVGPFDNMAIEAMPHEETVESFDVLPLTLRLKEIKLVTAQFQALPPQKVAAPNNASTVNRGEQQPKESAAIGLGGGKIMDAIGLRK